MFRGSVKGTGYPLHSPVSTSFRLPASPCAITFQLKSTTLAGGWFRLESMGCHGTISSPQMAWNVDGEPQYSVRERNLSQCPNYSTKNPTWVSVGRHRRVWDNVATDRHGAHVGWNIIYLLAAIGLSPGGSGYFTCIQNMKSVTNKFKSGGLHEKHVVATWNVGNRLSVCL